MNVPAIALKTFQELRKETKYLELVQFILKRLNKSNRPVKRARYLHELIDQMIQPVFSHPLVKQLSPCQQGCSACCHTQVSVTEDEAHLLALRVNEGLEIDREKLKRQTQTKNNSQAFYGLSYEERKCVFLDENGSCRIYADRPAVCRTNAVIGSADQCDTSQEQKSLRLVKTPEADVAIYAAYLHARASGSLPYMLSKILGLLDH